MSWMTKTFPWTVPLLSFCCQAMPVDRLGPPPNEHTGQIVAGRKVIGIFRDKSGQVRFSSANKIIQDRGGRVWVAGEGGVHVYDELRDRWTTFQSGVLKSPTSSMKMIAESVDRRIWVASMPVVGPNLSQFDGYRWSIIRRFSLPISTIFSGREGVLWFGMGKELVPYRADRWGKPFDVSAASGVDLPRIITGLEDRDGNIWIGWRNGALRLEALTGQWTNQLGQDKMAPVSIIYEDSKGRIWFANLGTVIGVYDKSSDSWSGYDMRSALAKLAEFKDARLLFSQGVNSISQDGTDQLMFGTRRGLIVYTESQNRWELFTCENSALPSETITALMEDRVGRMWIGTSEGLVILDRRS